MKLNLILFFMLAGYSVVFAQSESTRMKQFNVKKGIALEGYDPVSYFNGSPQEGEDEIKTTYKSVTYLFSSQANLNKFKMSPEKYEPQYGGWCAYAMGSTGEKVKIDPETYKIMDGKLYLFYNFWGSNTLIDWNKNENKLKESGDLNWKKFIQSSH